ncbi:probable elongation factor 1-beta [Bactrocera oleae]|uniref:probable elongation factor 1-beta n=1 Tax=Bactrocera oleae TaxID=104688 RepID=UPI00387E2819
MAFGDVSTSQGLKESEKFLTDNSYICGYSPSNVDLSVFEVLGKESAGKFSHVNDMENNVRSIEMDGHLWGASKLVPVGYGINKLQIMCVIEDDKVSIDFLTEKSQEFEDFAQSVDIAALNKI